MPRRACLVVTKEDIPVQGFCLYELLKRCQGTIAVGRGPTCELHMDHISCSRKHAEFSWSECTLWIKDLNSTHGTYLAIANGPMQRLPPHKNIRVDINAKLVLGASKRTICFSNLDRLKEEMQVDLGCSSSESSEHSSYDKLYPSSPDSAYNIAIKERGPTPFQDLLPNLLTKGEMKIAKKSVHGSPEMQPSRQSVAECNSGASPEGPRDDSCTSYYEAEVHADLGLELQFEELDLADTTGDILEDESMAEEFLSVANVCSEVGQLDCNRDDDGQGSGPGSEGSPTSVLDSVSTAQSAVCTKLEELDMCKPKLVDKEHRAQVAVPEDEPRLPGLAFIGEPNIEIKARMAKLQEPGEIPASEFEEVTSRPILSVDQGSKLDKWVLILDTNILLDLPSFDKLKKLVSLRREDLVKIVIPRIVLRELDGLNHRQDQLMRAQIAATFKLFEVEQLRACSLAATILHLQRPDEPEHSGEKLFAHHEREKGRWNNDDYIMETAHYFKQKVAGLAHVVVVTNDRLLRLWARNENLNANAGSDCLNSLLQICSAAKTSSTSHPMNREEKKPDPAIVNVPWRQNGSFTGCFSAIPVKPGKFPAQKNWLDKPLKAPPPPPPRILTPAVPYELPGKRGLPGLTKFYRR